MEPRSFKRGNYGGVWQLSPLIRASMEPRSFKRGNLQIRRIAPRPAVLQWSHVHSNVETGITFANGPAAHRLQMEPRSFKRGNLQSTNSGWVEGGASMEPRSFKRGNGDGQRNDVALDSASMEPRSFKRGNNNIERKSLCPHNRFNGATFIQTWKPAVFDRDKPGKKRFNGATFIQTWKRVH